MDESLEAMLRQSGMIIRSAAEWPMIFAIVFADGQIVDAGNAAAHIAEIVKFPVLISVGAKPISRIVMPFVRKSDGDVVCLKRPQFFDEAIVEFLVPFAGEELNDDVASAEEFGTIAPDGIDGVGQRDALRVARVPGVFGQANFLDGGIGVEGRERWASSFHIAPIILMSRSWLYKRLCKRTSVLQELERSRCSVHAATKANQH